jgi:hypothetical protein
MGVTINHGDILNHAIDPPVRRLNTSTPALTVGFKLPGFLPL